MKLVKFILTFAFFSVLTAQDVKVFEMRNFRHYHYDEGAVVIRKKMKVQIKAIGASNRWHDKMFASGWILDSKTRDVIWELSNDNSKRQLGQYNRQAEEVILLKPGNYELYFAVSYGSINNRDYDNLGDFLEDLFSGFQKGTKYNRYADEWGIVLSVDPGNEKYIDKVPMEDAGDAVVQIIPMNDDENENYGFSLTQKTQLRIYAIGEGDDGEMNDYGWIINAGTGETVWDMTYRHTKWAGGADKNRLIDEEITLKKGDYIVYYITDGSHSYEKWNMMPPKDPRYWGITIFGAERNFNLKSRVKVYKQKKSDNMIVDITRVGNDFYDQQEFKLSHEADLRLRCLGEYGSNRRFVDYGYIVNLETMERVWEMDRNKTRKAGGDSKNRMFDGLITLEPGIYRVCYISDDSYSYRDFNSSPPFNPRAWGISLWGGADFKDNWIEPYTEKNDPDMLVYLVRAFNRDRLRGKFRLDKRTRVRIFGLGERDGDEMADYGWIEDRDGRRIWEMDAQDSQYAGGDRKNRLFNDSIRLDAGEYYVFYRTDGSHSFESWNADPPDDPIYWGITVRRDR